MKSYRIEFEIIAESGQSFKNENVLIAMRELIKNFNNIREVRFIDKNEN